jgi:hypothetical protein
MFLIGPGETVNSHIDKILEDKDCKIFALQKVFPHCHIKYGIEPDFWTWQDPHGSLEGMQYILNNKNKFLKMRLVLPKYVVGERESFKQYCGTTAINTAKKWQDYTSLLSKVREAGLRDIIVNSTTTKHISLYPFLNKDYYEKEISGKDCYLRFALEKVIYGTVPFDSDRVMGIKYKWGLENKLSSVMFPLAHFLGAKEVYPVGFDFVGSRFYDKNSKAGTWGDDAKEVSRNMEVAIESIEKWKNWSSISGMKIKSMIQEDSWILNSVLEKK